MRNIISFCTEDLNGLKLVNDTIGHSAGDKLLQGFARLLADAAGDAYLETDTHTSVQYDHKGQQCDDDNRPDIFFWNIGVHDLADKQGKEHGECGGGQHEKQRECKLASVGLHILKDTF